MNFRSRSEQQQQPAEDAPKSVRGGTALRPADHGSEEEHYVDLHQTVAELSQDHAQLRAFIYEFARIRLRKDLYPRFVEGAWFEIEEQMRGLERAIDRIEANFAQNALPGQSNHQIASTCIFTPICDNIRSCPGSCDVHDNSTRTSLDVAVRRADRSGCTE